MFATWSPYDDEGYILVSLKGFADGGQLYDVVFSQYGPFFFELWGGLFSLLGIGVSHDAGRTVTLVLWVIASGLTGMVAWRASGSLVIGLAVQLLAFRTLAVLRGEPMHPGGLVCLLGVLLIAAALVVGERRARQGMLLVGALAAALILTKINVGVFALAAVVLVCFSVYPVLSGHEWIRRCVETAFVLTPIVLIGSDFSLGWAREFALHIAIAALAVVLALRTLPPDSDRRADELAWLGAGALGTTVVVCLTAILLGTSPGGLIDGVIVTPLGQPGAFKIPYQLPGFALPLDIAMLALCVACRLALGRGLASRRGFLAARGLVSAGAAVLIALTVASIHFAPNGSGTPTTELAALGVAWIALLARPVAGSLSAFVARLIPAYAVLQALHAYPVAGSQVNFAALFLLLVGALCASGAVRDLQEVIASQSVRRWATAAATAVLSLAALAIADLVIRQDGSAAKNTYDAGVKLDLPGSSQIRLLPDTRAPLREVSAVLSRRCNTFLSLPGLNSFYLWSEEAPPTGNNATAWMTLFDDATQRDIVAASKPRDRLCVLKNRSIAEAWQHGKPLSGNPLVRFMHTEFRPIYRNAGYVVMVREPGVAG